MVAIRPQPIPHFNFTLTVPLICMYSMKNADNHFSNLIIFWKPVNSPIVIDNCCYAPGFCGNGNGQTTFRRSYRLPYGELEFYSAWATIIYFIDWYLIMFGFYFIKKVIIYSDFFVTFIRNKWERRVINLLDRTFLNISKVLTFLDYILSIAEAQNKIKSKKAWTFSIKRNFWRKTL